MRADDRDREEVVRERLTERPRMRPQRPVEPSPPSPPVAPPPPPEVLIPVITPGGLSLQQDWSWCNKCQGLFYGPGVSSSLCPVGGTHAPPSQSQSGNYSLPHNVAPDPSRQSDWRWCNKCQGLFFGGGVAASHCPAGGIHAAPAQSGSGNYSLPHRSFTDPRVTTPPVSSPPVKKVITSRLALDYPIQLRFDQQEHPYLFPASAGASVGAEIERILLPYPADDPNSRRYSYFRDVTKPNLFFYLPDSFKLARKPTPPFVPNMAIDFGQNESAEKAHVTITAELRPAVNSARLDAAKIALKSHVPVSSATTSTEPELEPLQAKATLKLGLPRSGQVQTVETDSVVNLINGFLVDEDFSLSDFQTVFAALNATGVSAVFRGDVVVSTGLAAPDLVPVEIRFADMEGQILICDEKTDSAAGTVAATLRNATESPLKIEALPVWLTRDGAKIQGRIDDLDLSAPAMLEPNASITITIHPTQPLPGQGALDAMFDLSRVRSQPDPQKILTSITDQSVLPEALRQITVVTAPNVFDDKASPETSISYIGVEFLGGKQVVLRANEVEKEVDVPVPLVDWLLPRDTEGFYNYRKVIGFKSGNTSQPSAWTRSDLGILSV